MDASASPFAVETVGLAGVVRHRIEHEVKLAMDGVYGEGQWPFRSVQEKTRVCSGENITNMSLMKLVVDELARWQTDVPVYSLQSSFTASLPETILNAWCQETSPTSVVQHEGLRCNMF